MALPKNSFNLKQVNFGKVIFDKNIIYTKSTISKIKMILCSEKIYFLKN